MSDPRPGIRSAAATAGPSRPHVLGQILRTTKDRPAARQLRLAALATLALLGLATLKIQIDALSPPFVYLKDFKEDYLLARAVLDGVNPYVLSAVLAHRFVPAAEPYALPHPIPHPPFASLVFSPLGFLPYQTAAALWLGLELLFLLVTVSLIGRVGSPGHSLVYALAASAALLIWPPVWGDLVYGQLSLLLAILLAGCWAAYRAGRLRLAGCLLGLSIAIKLFPVAIAGYFLVKRQWRVFAWALATATVATGAAAIVLGADAMRSYVFEALPAGNSWRSGEGNHSAISIVWRLLAGSRSIDPLIDWPWAADPLSILAGVGILAVAAHAVISAEDPDVEFSLAMCAMLLVSPVTWQHYFVLLIWPLWIVAQRLRLDGWEPRRTNLFIITVLMLTVPPGPVMGVAAWLGRLAANGVVEGQLPGIAGLPLVSLMVGPALLFHTCWAELRRHRSRQGLSLRMPSSPSRIQTYESEGPPP